MSKGSGNRLKSLVKYRDKYGEIDFGDETDVDNPDIEEETPILSPKKEMQINGFVNKDNDNMR